MTYTSSGYVPGFPKNKYVRFKPIHLDTLRNECIQFIGSVFKVQCEALVIEDGLRAGEIAVQIDWPLPEWVPSGDLEDI